MNVNDGDKITLSAVQLDGVLELGVSTNSTTDIVTLHLKGEKNETSVIYCYTSLTITAEENAKLKVSGKESGIASEGNMVIEGGDIDIDSGLFGLGVDYDGKFTLNGGNVTINAGYTGVYGLKNHQPEMNGGTLNITVPSEPPTDIIDADTFTAAMAVMKIDLLTHPLKLGKPDNLPGFIGWNVNGVIMQTGDELVTATLSSDGSHTSIKNLSITPAFSYPAASSVPQTGDSANIALWLSLLAVSVLGVITLGRKMKKA